MTEISSEIMLAEILKRLQHIDESMAAIAEAAREFTKMRQGQQENFRNFRRP